MENVRLTKDNINRWPKWEKLLSDGKIKFDEHGRLRYWHGAAVGDLIFVRKDKNDIPVYKESTNEWFDPESQEAKNFRWPAND